MQSNKAIQASQASAGELPQRVSSIKQYLRQGRIIVAEIARQSGNLRRVVRSQYSPKETLKAESWEAANGTQQTLEQWEEKSREGIRKRVTDTEYNANIQLYTA
jgi:hypothetical protein